MEREKLSYGRIRFPKISKDNPGPNIIRNTGRDFRGDFYPPRTWIATEAGG